MRGREEIEIDFLRAVNQANELNQIANELSQIAKAQIEGAFAMLASSWKGENEAQYVAKGQLLTEDILETADDLIKVADNIRVSANFVYQAEKAH